MDKFEGIYPKKIVILFGLVSYNDPCLVVEWVFTRLRDGRKRAQSGEWSFDFFGPDEDHKKGEQNRQLCQGKMSVEQPSTKPLQYSW